MYLVLNFQATGTPTITFTRHLLSKSLCQVILAPIKWTDPSGPHPHPHLHQQTFLFLPLWCVNCMPLIIREVESPLNIYWLTGFPLLWTANSYTSPIYLLFSVLCVANVFPALWYLLKQWRRNFDMQRLMCVVKYVSPFPLGLLVFINLPNVINIFSYTFYWKF